MTESAPHAYPPSASTFRVGTSGWTYAHWQGRFYPQSLPKQRWFRFYASQFPAVEVNATFYRAFKEQTYQRWKQNAPPGFGYVLKAPRLITHRKYLLDVAAEIQEFSRASAHLGERLEMILLQVAPGTPYDLARLEQALLAFPQPEKVAVEFRHPQWYSPQVADLLRSLGAAFCNVDSPRQKLTELLTAQRAYLRLHGRTRWYAHCYSEEELVEIAALARRLAERGAQQVYIFFNNDFEGYAPANARRLLQLL